MYVIHFLSCWEAAVAKAVMTASSQLSDYGTAFKVGCLYSAVPVVASVPGCVSSTVLCSCPEPTTLALSSINFESTLFSVLNLSCFL